MIRVAWESGWIDLGTAMESDLRYYARRASEEARAAARALTPAAQARRLLLAEQFNRRLAELQG